MSSSSHDSKDFFLSKESGSYSPTPSTEIEDEDLYDLEIPKFPRPSLFRRLTPFLLHCLLIFIYSAAFLLAWRQRSTTDSLGIPFVDNVFEVNPALNKSIARKYAGEPSDELENAWMGLLKNANIRVPEAEIRKLDRLDQSVRFTDGSGYFAQMTVYHHLHCIRRIHRFLHMEHYWPNATSEEISLLQAHNYHCLDTLRQAIMCQGDTSLITFRWGQSQPVPLGNFSSPHKCRSWEELDEWNAERYVDVFQPGLVVHPTLGPAYGVQQDRAALGVVVESD
ncbi:hypothetical protein B0J14DRAFT_693270 [Halenospora varia]|nr:hypothetical protein B0J14DRAFT_693270 [Halenospora varia]